MRRFNRLAVLLFFAGAAAIGGCARHESVPWIALPAAKAAQVTAACANGLLVFASDASGTAVDIYSGTHRCGTIGGLLHPQGLAVDSSADLWVADTGASNVLEFEPPYSSKPVRTLNDPGFFPSDVALCRGYEAVTNITSTSGGAGNVEIYSGKATSPTSTLSDPNSASERFGACDPGGDVFTSYLTGAGTGAVNEWIGGRGKPRELSAITPGFPGGIEWEGAALWVDDQTARTIGIWKPPFSTVSTVIALHGSGDPVTFAVSPTDSVILAGTPSAAIFYNLSGKPIGTIPGSGGGVAYSRDDR